ncbi:MAG: hypothetical protein ACHQ1G_01025 [Planctomycetota bacterium]
MTQRTSLALLLLLGAAIAGPVEYEFIPLPGLGSSNDAGALAVNDRRQLSGTAFPNLVPDVRAVLWAVAPDNSATVQDIGLVAGRLMWGGGLNNRGQLVGQSGPGGDGFAFLWTGGNPVELENGFDLLGTGTFNSFASVINDTGLVSGAASGSASQDFGPWHAVVWDPAGAMHDLGTLGGEWSFGYGVNERNMTCGRSEFELTSFATRGFRWDPDTGMEKLDILPGLGHVSSQGKGMNNHGDVAGISSAQIFMFGPNSLGVVWYADGTTRKLDAIGTPGVDDIYSDAGDINDAGWVVGTSSLGTFLEVAHPILWLPDGSRVDFMSLLPADITWASAVSVSNTGWISGLMRKGSLFTSPSEAFVLRPTPATQIGMLMDQVDRLDLGGIGRGLNLQLHAALRKLTDGRSRNDRAAAALLSIFALEVRLLERWRRIDPVEADSLFAVVNDALATLRQ